MAKNKKMVNINLSTHSDQNKEKFELGKAVILSIFLLVLVVGGYLGIFFYTKKINGEIETAKATYLKKVEELKEGNAKNVFDFQKRLTESKKLIASVYNPNDGLAEIEKSLIPQIYLSGYSLDADTKDINLICVASNYGDIAKQIFNFKKSSYFSEVIIGKTSMYGTDGKINFEVGLQIK